MNHGSDHGAGYIWLPVPAYPRAVGRRLGVRNADFTFSHGMYFSGWVWRWVGEIGIRSYAMGLGYVRHTNKFTLSSLCLCVELMV